MRYENDITKLAIGQEVAIAATGSYRTHYSFGWVVSRISKTGQITLAKEGQADRRFTSSNKEVGASKCWRVPYIETNVAEVKAREEKEAASRAAAMAISEITGKSYGSNPSKESLLEQFAALEEQMAKAKALISAL